MSIAQRMLDIKKENAALKEELGRAYRAVHGFYNAHRDGKPPSDAMVGYHTPTIAAAARFVREGSLEGTNYFIGKHVSVLHEALGVPHPKNETER